MPQSKILVADDSQTTRAVVCRILSSAGYDVTLAADGIEAVQFARRDHPDLVIIDVQMPETDGYMACEEILEMADRSSHFPIIIHTQDNAKHLVALGNELGAYLQKPVTEEQLLSTVEQLLQNCGAQETCTGTNE